MNSSEKLTKAAQTAELLVQDLQELRSHFYSEQMTITKSMAVEFAYDMLQDAVLLKQKLERIAR